MPRRRVVSGTSVTDVRAQKVWTPDGDPGSARANYTSFCDELGLGGGGQAAVLHPLEGVVEARDRLAVGVVVWRVAVAL